MTAGVDPAVVVDGLESFSDSSEKTPSGIRCMSLTAATFVMLAVVPTRVGRLATPVGTLPAVSVVPLRPISAAPTVPPALPANTGLVSRPSGEICGVRFACVAGGGTSRASVANATVGTRLFVTAIWAKR